MRFVNIEAILFDMGRTLRDNRRDPKVQQEWLKKLLPLTRLNCTTADLAELLTQRAKAYKQWGEETLVELSPCELWQHWLLPEETPEYVEENYLEMNRYWRKAIGEGILYPHAVDVIKTLFKRGYRLGIISNTVSSEETPGLLAKYNLEGYFETVVLSCNFGTRKPSASIFQAANGFMGVEPYHCAYVGDQIDRDIYGSKAAGYAASIYIDHGNLTNPVADLYQTKPDAIITSLNNLLDLFPDRYHSQPASKKRNGLGKTKHWDVTLSTMWTVENKIPLQATPAVLDELELSSLELNHSIRSHDLIGVDLSPLPIRSLHEPCPADVSLSTLAKKDWLISAIDEQKRMQGVRMVKRSIDLADRLGINHIVVHPGTVGLSNSEEKKLRNLIEARQNHSLEAEEIRAKMVVMRSEVAPARMMSVRKSLQELLDYIGDRPIQLALENRYHYMDIPSPVELGELLGMAGSDKIGFQLDVGHAFALDRLGFYPMIDWLKQYGSRILGVHLHDVVMVEDHTAPGKGEIDYRTIADLIPPNAQRTLEVRGYNTSESIREGLFLLESIGIVHRVE